MTDPTATPGPISGIPMIGIHVSDTDRALGFYRDVLGLRVAADVPIQQLGGRMVILAVPGTDMVLALMPAADGEPAGTNTGVRLQVEDAEAWHAYLREAGGHVDEMLRWPGIPPMFVFNDPDGNRLVIVS